MFKSHRINEQTGCSVCSLGFSIPVNLIEVFNRIQILGKAHYDIGIGFIEIDFPLNFLVQNKQKEMFKDIQNSEIMDLIVAVDQSGNILIITDESFSFQSIEEFHDQVVEHHPDDE